MKKLIFCLFLYAVGAVAQPKYTSSVVFDTTKNVLQYALVSPNGERLTPYMFDSDRLLLDMNGNVGVDDYWYNKHNPILKTIDIRCHEGKFVFCNTNGKYGFMDTTAKVVIPAIYDNVSWFSEGLAAVKKNDKWGFINHKGEIVIPYQYDQISASFKKKVFPPSFGHPQTVIDTCAWVVPNISQVENGSYYIDKKNVKLDVKYAVATTDSLIIRFKWQKYYMAYGSGNTEGVVDTLGNWLLRVPRDSMGYLSNYIFVTKNGKKAVWNAALKCIYPPVYDNVGFSYNAPYCTLCANNAFGKTLLGIGDTLGNVLIPPKYIDIKHINDNLFRFTSLDENNAQKFGIVSATGQELIPAKYKEIQYVNTRFVLAKTDNNLWGIVTITDSLLYPFVCSEFRYPQQSGYPINLLNVYQFAQNGKWGALNNSAKIIIPPIYDQISQSQGYWHLTNDNKTALASVKNLKHISPEYNYISEITAKYFTVATSNKFGVIDTAYNIIIPIKYNEVYLGANYSIVKGNKGKYFLWDIQKLKSKFCFKSPNNINVVGYLGDKIIITENKPNGLNNPRYFVINSNGKRVTPYYNQLYIPQPTSDTCALRYILNDNCGCLNAKLEQQGEVYSTKNYDGFVLATDSVMYGGTESILSYIYGSSKEYLPNLKLIKHNNKMGLINTLTHKIVQPTIWDNIHFDYTHEDDWEYELNKGGFIATKDGKTALLNTKGQLMAPMKYKARLTLERLLIVEKKSSKKSSKNIPNYYEDDEYPFRRAPFIIKTSTKLGIYSNNGVRLFKPQFTEIEISYYERSIYYKVARKGRYALIEPTTKRFILPYQKKEASIAYLNTKASAVKQKGKWGIKNNRNRWICPPKFDAIGMLNNNKLPVYTVLQNKQWGLINSNGKWIVMPSYKYIKKQNIYYPTCLSFQSSINNKMGIIDTGGNVLLSAEYDTIMINQQKLAAVKKDSLWGLIDLNTKQLLVPIEYNSVNLPYDNNFCILNKNKKYGCLLPNGTIIAAQYDTIQVYGHLLSFKRNDTIQLMFKNTQQLSDIKYRNVISCLYDYLYTYIATTFDKQTDIYNKEGKKIGKITNYEKININEYNRFINIIGTDKNMQCFLVTNDSLLISKPIPTQADSIESSYLLNKYILIKNTKGKYGVFDWNGKLVLPIKYDKIENYRVYLQNKQGYFNPETGYFIEAIYDNIDFPFCYLNKKIDIYNTQTQRINVLKADDINPYNPDYIVTKNGLSALFDSNGQQKCDFTDKKKILSENCVICNGSLAQYLNNKWQIIYKDSLYVLDCDTLYYIDYNNCNIFIVRKNNKYGWVIPWQNINVPAKYDTIISTGKYIYVKQSDNYAIISLRDSLVASSPYSIYVYLDNGQAVITHCGKLGLYDAVAQKLIIPPLFNRYHDGVFYATNSLFESMGRDNYPNSMRNINPAIVFNPLKSTYTLEQLRQIYQKYRK